MAEVSKESGRKRRDSSASTRATAEPAKRRSAARSRAGSSADSAPATAPTDLAEIVGHIGPKIAGLRKAQGLSLQQLAASSDVSAAAIHKIERNGMVPTITTLLKLASALGVPVSYFVQEQELHPEPVHHTPVSGRREVYTPHQGLRLDSVSGSYRQFQAAAAVASMRPGASSGERFLRHPGEELVYVLRGSARFTVGGQEFELSEGDSLHWSGDIPHTWENHADDEAELVWVVLRGS